MFIILNLLKNLTYFRLPENLIRHCEPCQSRQLAVGDLSPTDMSPRALAKGL
ncbi:MAG: hypothetical protein J5680_02520 [Neisseriaceae bacterium]|nr:hypothetical protein [Neisseriaceae bacterium]